MRWLKFGSLALVVVLLQLSLLPALRPFGVVPSIVLALVVMTALKGTASLATAVAVTAGILMDLASGSDFGLRTGSLVMVVLAVALLHRAGFELDGVLVAIAITAASTLLMAATILLSVPGGFASWPPGPTVARLVAELVLNLGLVLALRPAVYWAIEGRRGSSGHSRVRVEL